MPAAQIPFDTSLLNGFRFSCRSDCALCCYTTPAVTAREITQLRVERPDIPVVISPEGHEVIADCGNGGACRMLSGRRCSVYPARPGPCSTFPVSVHGGRERWQASLVLSCPGLVLDTLSGWTNDPMAPPCAGLEPELAAALHRSRSEDAARALLRDAAARRRAVRAIERSAATSLPESVRRKLRGQRIHVRSEDLPGELPPSAEDGPQYLPLVWEGPHQVAGLESTPWGCRFVPIEPSGRHGEPSEVFPLPRSLPSLTQEAGAMLDGYLRYWLERDALFDFVLTDSIEGAPDTSLEERIASELSFIGATTISRAAVRSRRGGTFAAALGRDAIVQGIQATDQDLLDRPSLGVRL